MSLATLSQLPSHTTVSQFEENTHASCDSLKLLRCNCVIKLTLPEPFCRSVMPFGPSMLLYLQAPWICDASSLRPHMFELNVPDQSASMGNLLLHMVRSRSDETCSHMSHPLMLRKPDECSHVSYAGNVEEYS
jgi:hypothetical protein